MSSSKYYRNGLLIVLIGFFCRIHITFSQIEHFYENWRWAHFTTNTGLPSNGVTDIVETADSIVWASTLAGVAWFDGYRWHKIPESSGLPERQAAMISEGPQNSILVVIDKNLYVGSLKGFTAIDLHGFSVATACMLDTATILISGNDLKPRIIIYKHGQIEKFSENGFARLLKTRTGKILLGSYHELLQLDNGRWKCILPYGILNTVADNIHKETVLAVVAPADQIGVWENRNNKKFERSLTERLLTVGSLDISSTGTVLVSYLSGEIHVRERNVWKTIEPIPSQMTNVIFLKFDHKDDLWVGTETGLYFFRASAKRWSQWKHKFSDSRDIIMEMIQCKNGDIWIGNANGVEVRHPNGKIEYISNIKNRQLGLITGIAEDKEGNVWISSGASFEGAYRWNGKVWKHFGFKEGLKSPRVHKIKKDKKGNLWFLGLGINPKINTNVDPGAFQYDGKHFYQTNTDNGLLHNRVYSFAESKSGALWFGTRIGLCRKQGNRWKYWDNVTLQSANSIYSIEIDSTDRLWFSDFAMKVGYIDQNDSLHLVWNKNLDYSYRFKVWDIKVDHVGVIWIATAGGLFSYQNDALASYNLETASKLKELRVVLPLKDKIYVGGAGIGIGILDRREMGFPINITVSEPIVEDDKIHLRWYADAYWGAMLSEDIEVSFRLDSNEWSEWSNLRTVSFHNLSDGPHTFEIQARDVYGNIRNNKSSISFLVPPPFLKRPIYFIPLTGLFITTIVLLVRNIRAKLAHAKIIQEQRERIANDLHDEVGSNLGSIALISQRISRNVKVTRAVKDDLSVITATAIQTAEYLRDIVWYVNPRYDNLSNLETRLREIAGVLLPKMKLEFKINDTVGNDIDFIDMRKNILLMFKEILHNILKHSKATKVIISIDRHPRIFKLSVTDNGVGFNKFAEYMGNGLSSLKRRASETGAFIDINSKKGAGTSIIIIFKK